jgi:CBS-domain-containing membrane protein
MITDRDVCMAAYSMGLPLGEMTVDTVMARNVITCRAGDDLKLAHERMREHQLRRLPVVDEADVLVGIVSLADIARVTSQGATKAARQKGAESFLETMTAVSRPRFGVALEAMPLATD